MRSLFMVKPDAPGTIPCKSLLQPQVPPKKKDLRSKATRRSTEGKVAKAKNKPGTVSKESEGIPAPNRRVRELANRDTL